METKNKLNKQLAKVAAAKSNQAVQGEVAPDMIERSGVKFYKPNMASIWFLNRLKMNVNGFASLADFGVCLVYACSLDQKQIRNIAMPAISKGNIADVAYGFILLSGLTEADVNDVLEELWNPILNKDDNGEDGDEESGEEEEEADASPKPQGSSPSGGAK